MRFLARSCACVISTLYLISASFAFSQVQKSQLAASLSGSDVRSLITIGETGIFGGYESSWPVNTLVYPDGHIVYRIELAIIHGEVGQMDKSFDTGTSFHVSNIEFKDDRFELKLLAEDHASGRLKVMLGPGWQGRMKNADVLQIMQKFLTSPSISVGAEGTVPAASALASVPTVSAPVRPEVQVFPRPVAAAAIPGRPTQSYVQAILSGIQPQVQAAANQLHLKAAYFAEGFQAFRAAYPQGRQLHPLQELAVLRGELGSDFIPRTSEDVAAMQGIFARCIYTASLQGGVDNNGRPYGSGSDSRIYRNAFLSRGAQETLQRSTEELQAALGNATATSERAKQTQSEIIQIERVLDAGNLQEANRLFALLSADTAVLLPETTKYLAASADVRADLTAYSQAASVHAVIEANPLAHIQEIEAEESSIDSSAAKPITVTNLHTYVAEDKAALRKQLDSLPQFESSVRPFTQKTNLSTSAQHSSEQYDDANRSLEQLRKDLQACHDLAELTGDQAAMRLIRSWYGDETANSLIQKTTGLKAAWENEARLSVYIEGVQAVRAQEEAQQRARLEAIQRAHDQEEARQKALIEERNSLAGTIWNKVLYITMLDEKFNLTEKMGYTMEADKQRTTLNNLLRQDRAMLTPSLWSEVNQEYQRILPGLTVWQASHARSIIAGLHSSGR